jgi:hypothetical protein
MCTTSFLTQDLISTVDYASIPKLRQIAYDATQQLKTTYAVRWQWSSSFQPQPVDKSVHAC